MKFHMKQSLVLAAALGLQACVTPPGRHEVTREAGLPGASLDATWNAVIDLFGERAWTIANMEKASGFINSDWMSATSTSYLDCGSSGLTVDSGQRGRFNVIVRQPEPTGEVTVTVNTVWQTNRALGTGTPFQVECVSTGRLESEIHRLLRERLSVRTSGTP